jgi:hypothetical protein
LPWLAPGQEPASVSASPVLLPTWPSRSLQASSVSTFPAHRPELALTSHLAVRSETPEAERSPAATRSEIPLAAHRTHSHPDSRRTASKTNTPPSPAATGTTMPKLRGRLNKTLEPKAFLAFRRLQCTAYVRLRGFPFGRGITLPSSPRSIPAFMPSTLFPGWRVTW